MPTAPRARAQIDAALETQAARTARTSIKSRARTYAGRRGDLDAIATGLSRAAPETLIATGANMLRMEAAA